MPDNRGSSITLIGAISSKRGLVYFEVFSGSNNSTTFSGFIARLRHRTPGKAIVIMDNLSIHKAKIVSDLFDEEEFRQIFLPTHSSTLNPIERLWAVVKKPWKQGQHWNAFLNRELKSEERD